MRLGLEKNPGKVHILQEEHQLDLMKTCPEEGKGSSLSPAAQDLFEREVGTTSYAMPRMEHGGQGSGIIGFERKVEQELALVKMDGYEFGGRRLQVKSYVCSKFFLTSDRFACVQCI